MRVGVFDGVALAVGVFVAVDVGVLVAMAVLVAVGDGVAVGAPGERASNAPMSQTTPPAFLPSTGRT